MAELSESDVQPYKPPTSIWSLVETYVPEHERVEVKNVLGESLVDQSLELHEEVNTLYGIWREFRADVLHKPLYHRLPEPPAMRDRLKEEIKFFVETLQERADENGRDFEKILSNHNTDTIDYALNQRRPGSSGYNSRPSTSQSSHDGRETPLIRMTPMSDRSALTDKVEAINDKLNVWKLDQVKQHLRDTMSEEIKMLLADVEFLQGCLEDESDPGYLSASLEREPTLTDLKEERSALEKELLSSDMPVPQALRDYSKPPTPPSKPLLVGPSSGGVRLRALSTTSTASLVQPHAGPLKASHNIGAHADGTTPTTHAPRSPSTLVTRCRINVQPPTHVTIRTGSLKQAPAGAVCHIAAVGGAGEGTIRFPESAGHIPSPPTSAKSSAASSANSRASSRFRKMVLSCRDDR
ncbi:hypothetical protein NP493_203g03005 [Ridgeia piscesae]|uniref:Uncharacterized protein n=1 Tax=Ridgeia piscesae TaxID=27915 RepID=A0AAD9UEI0_RIDPI|nr:hypothetical protein NP493_203g03005 [Ridgeia piscesae]